jgi:hypothetical protein
MDLEIDVHTDRKVDWNINDFELAEAIKFMVDHFVGALTTLDETVEHFEALFPNVAAQKNTLLDFSGKVTESNYVDKVEYLLTNGDAFKASIQVILKSQKFIKKNFSKVKNFKRFIQDVVAELKKADRTDRSIADANEEFLRLYNQDMVKNYNQLLQQAQLAKDSYFSLVKNAAAGMSHAYTLLQGKVDGAIRDLKQNYPVELNAANLKKLENIKRYCSDRIIAEPNLEFSISCSNCGYSLSDVLNYTALSPTKESELVIIQSSFVAQAPPPSQPQPDQGVGQTAEPGPIKIPRKIKLQLPGKAITVQEYKTFLTTQLTALAAAQPDEKIQLDIETL